MINKNDISLSNFEKNRNESDSDDDSEVSEQSTLTTPDEQIDSTELQGFPWIWYYIRRSAQKTYEVCDAVGEKLAWFFGITKPKYYAELQEYERMSEEERQTWRQAFQDIEENNDILDSIVTRPPQAVNLSMKMQPNNE